MPPARVYADFNNLDDCNRLRLTCAGTVKDLAHQGIQLREGLALTFYTDDADDQGQPDELLVEGTVHYDEAERAWSAVVDWSAVWHASAEPQGVNGSIAPAGQGHPKPAREE